MSNRENMLAGELRQILSQAICFQMRDPYLASITITEVQVSADLQYADVKITTGGEPAGGVLTALKRAKGALRSIIAKNISLRRVPELRFHIDKGLEARDRINDILGGLSIPPEETEETSDET